MIRLRQTLLLDDLKTLLETSPSKLLIHTINAHSYNVARKDEAFAQALLGCDVLIPDGASIVWACRWLKAESQPRQRVSGWDLFVEEMEQLNRRGGKCFFLGSSQKVLDKIKERAAIDYPNIAVETYSPPYTASFTEEESEAMVAAINAAQPDLLWIGMTAPKQEKWVYQHWKELNIQCHCGAIGAVFDFYAGTMKRAPRWWQTHGLEWLYRLLKEPRRLWRRYLIGNVRFVLYIFFEKWA